MRKETYKRSKQYKRTLEKIWGSIGYIVQLSQMLEYNIAGIITLHEILRELKDKNEVWLFEYNEYAERANDLSKKITDEKWTFGMLKNKLKETNLLSNLQIEKIEKLLGLRNMYVHNFFKKDLFDRKLETEPSFYLSQIQQDVLDFYDLHNEIFKIELSQRDALKEWR